MEFKVGNTFKESFVINQKQVDLYGEITGDRNPVHFDEEYAKKIGFERCIVHGMLVSSYFSKTIGMKFPGEGSIYLGQDLKFDQAVLVDEELVVQLTISKIREDKPILFLDTIIFKAVNPSLVCVSGQAVVKYRQN